MRRCTVLATALLLTACGHNSTSVSPDSGGSPPATTPGALCVTTECGTKTVLLEIPGAENTLFTPDGRLFVSGSENVYEITRVDDNWLATPISATACNFTGLARVGGTLYANCFDGQLYATMLTAQPQLAPIHDLGLSSPNGLTDGPDGELYVVNGPLSPSALPDPKIVRLRLEPGNPLAVDEQSDWMATGELTFPNGIQRRGRTLYYTQSDTLGIAPGVLQSVEIQTDGSAGEPQVIGYYDTLLDDFGLAGESFLLTNYAGGSLAIMNAAGEIEQESLPASFDNPSSVKLGQPPLFATGELVITEKGMVGLPPTPGYGNVLSVLRPNP